MAKANFQTIDFYGLSTDITIKSNSKYNGIYFKGLDEIVHLDIVKNEDTNDLVMNVNGHTVTLKDYFAKNGAFPIKTIKTEAGSYNFVDYLNENEIRGQKQKIMGSSLVKKLNGTVFDDFIEITASNYANAGGGNDEIVPSESNSTLIGGTGKNTIEYIYDDWDNKTFGKDVIQLTKGETLTLNIKYDNDSEVVDADLTFRRGTSKGATNDLIITNNRNDKDSITIKNYYGKETGATVLINGHDLTQDYDAYFHFDENHIKSENFSGSALADVIDASKVDLVKTVGKGKNKHEVHVGVKIKSDGGEDVITGSVNNDTITAGTGKNTIVLDTLHKFGDDTVVLTKGENLTFKLSDVIHIEDAISDGTFAYKIDGNDLVLTVNGNNELKSTVTIKNYASKDVLTSAGSLSVINYNGGEHLDLRESAEKETIMDSEHYNKSSYTGTWVDDLVDAEGYTVKDKKTKQVITESDAGFEKVKGVTVNLGGSTTLGNAFDGSIYADTIKATGGHNDIEGGKGNDVITGGKGDTFVHYSKGDGADTVNLTKGENFTLVLHDLDENKIKYAYTNKNKDLKVYYIDDEGNEAGSVTLKGFGKGDVTGADGFVKVQIGDGEPFVLKDNELIKIINKESYTGSWLSDNIDASGSDELKNSKNKHVNMVLDGGAGADTIVGSDFADTLKAGTGTGDVLTSGEGNDSLYASTTKGSETTFVFNKGDGQDVVYGGKGTDTIRFGNVLPNDITFAKKGNDLVLNYNHVEQNEELVAQDSVTIKNYYNGKKVVSSVKYLETESGKVLIETAMKYKELYPDLNLISKSGDITGSIYNDVVPASEAADTITAGKGDDLIIGASSNDTIVLNNGDGDDIIIIDAEHTPSKLVFADLPHLNYGSVIAGEVSGNDVIIKYNKIDDVFRNSVTLKDFFLNEASYNMQVSAGNSPAENIANIIVSNINNYYDKASVINGTKFKDMIYTTLGVRETVYAGDGNDTINDNGNGVNGDETGGDTIYGGAGKDHIYYEHASDATFIDSGEGDDLIRIYKGTAIGGLGEDEVRAYGDSTIYGDLTLEDDPTQEQGSADFIVGSEQNQTIYGGGGADRIVGNGGSDTIYGGAGGDTIYTGSNTGAGDSTADVETLVHGGVGDDTIYGQAVKNVMYGDEGNDTITGWSEGEDIFGFKKGDGTDTIYGGETGDTVDTIKFNDASITLGSLTPSFDGNDLIINYNSADVNDKIIIKDYLSEGAINSSIDTLEFYDGTKKSIKTDLNYTIYASTAETTGTALSDIIVSKDGIENTIHGGLGNDRIVSGNQNDTLYGDAGANTYEFNTGFGTDTVYATSGQDTLKFGQVGQNDIQAAIVGNDIEVTVTGSTDKVILKDYMDNIVDVTIKDNSGSEATLYEKAGMVVGDGEIGGNDNANRLIGGDDADTLIGHGGADILNGRGGSDTYVFYKGDGNDTVINGTDGAVDYLYFADSTKEDLSYDISGNDLIIRYNSAANSVTVKNYFLDGNTVTKLMDSAHTTKETALNIADINSYTVTFNPEAPEFENVVNGTPLNDTIVFNGNYTVTGGAGNDNITINGGTNTVEGGKGNDTINMGPGSTTLVFRNGDGHDTINMSNLATTDSYLQFMDSQYYSIKYELAENGKDMILWHNYDSGTETYKDSVTIKDWADYYDPAAEPAKIPALNIIKDSNGYYYSQTNILYQFVNSISNYEAQAATINGTKFRDQIYPVNGVKETINCGYGNDNVSMNTSSNNYVSGDGTGGDTIYGGAGDDTLYFNTRDNIFVDGGTGDDKIDFTHGIAIGGLGKDRINRMGKFTYEGEGSIATIYGDLTLEDNPAQDVGGDDVLFSNISSEYGGGNEIIYGGGGNDQIKGYGGTDKLYGGAGNDWIWANQGYSETEVYKDSTVGWTSEIHGGAGNDYLFAQVETNDLYGDAGDDNFYAYIDQKTTISDSVGTDTLKMYDTQTGDAEKTNLHVMFNVAAGYDYDSENVNTLFNGNVFVTGTATKANYDLWTSNDAFAGVSVTGNTVETIKSSDGYTLTNDKISQLASDVAAWLEDNGYGSVDGVFANTPGKSADQNAADITMLIQEFDNAIWTNP